MESLPEEIRQSVWQLLAVEDLARAAQTSQFWNGQCYNPSLWRDLYFKRFPARKLDDNFKQLVGDRWRTHLAYIRHHSDLLQINSINLEPKILSHIEEVLVSPCRTSIGSLFFSVNGFLGRVRDHFRKLQQNELFDVFSYDLAFISRWRATSFVQEFIKRLTAAKTSGKKVLLLLHDLDSYLNPTAQDDKYAEELLQVVNQHKEHIIVLGCTGLLDVMSPPLVKLFATHCTLVEVTRPDKDERKTIIIREMKKLQPVGFVIKLDVDFLAEKAAGLTLDGVIFLSQHIVLKCLGQFGVGRDFLNSEGIELFEEVELTHEQLESDAAELSFYGQRWETSHQALQDILEHYPNAQHISL